MAELVDAVASKAIGRKAVPVQIRLGVPKVEINPKILLRIIKLWVLKELARISVKVI